MAALALDQGEGKHPPGRRPHAGPLEAPAGAWGSSGASRPPIPTLRPPYPRGRLPRCNDSAQSPLPAAPPPWAGPGQLSPPAGGARPGAAPGSWPHSPRPFPAPRPPSSTPGVGDPEARRALGQKPGDAVVDAATSSASAAARRPSALFPARGPESVLPPSPAGCLVPQALARPGRPRRRAASRPARLSRLATQRCLLSQDWFRGGSRRADSPPAGAARPGPGAAPSRRSRSLPSAAPAPDRPPSGRRPASS